ncbi:MULTISPECIES: hypothetical protein [Aphanizomenonaceae]|uniref:Uncharacterized protein n=2 Tax=Dolichospermum TaxID=748770 RepID=A0A1Z4VA29_9CYAN|nr:MULTISPECIES: hypothetical protein [Aphanizomenonaceae]MDK2408912.1 hypothetical protein [Aphanizomenon sp. 202]MDK2459849.1 hypothetical protein [Aphanizomenon sp. PH219]MBE9260015.1 hypothetical protein [Dolichospermum sp. LEGE 00246]UUO16222.1 hypothetical protein NG743_04010 [Dolichospermum heterosporum TAC447]BAZ88284.1 hypothetical protein NIES806_45210 [Dolichospermum compactum NIES-806]
MTLVNYQAMTLKELRHYILTHREDIAAFHAYVDRSKSEGRMITINPNDENWEKQIQQAIIKDGTESIA